jgi:hypothetical protein
MNAATDRPDGLTDAAVKPRRTPTDYERGYLEGLQAFAHMRDGVLYVGTTGKTLRQAMRQFMDEVDL